MTENKKFILFAIFFSLVGLIILGVTLQKVGGQPTAIPCTEPGTQCLNYWNPRL